MMPRFEKMVLFLITICFFTTMTINYWYNIGIDKKTEDVVTEDEIITVEYPEEYKIQKENKKEELNLINLGEFKLTAYCSCSKCCGSWANKRPKDENGNEIVYGSIGEQLTAGYSIAVDPNIIPYGTEVIINNITYKAQDCGSGIKDNDIDIYFDNHDEALEFGVQYAEVFKVEK